MERNFKNIYLKSSLPLRYNSVSSSVIPFNYSRLLSTTPINTNNLLNYKNIQNYNITHSSILTNSLLSQSHSININNTLSLNTNFIRQYHPINVCL